MYNPIKVIKDWITATPPAVQVKPSDPNKKEFQGFRIASGGFGQNIVWSGAICSGSCFIGNFKEVAWRNSGWIGG